MPDLGGLIFLLIAGGFGQLIPKYAVLTTEAATLVEEPDGKDAEKGNDDEVRQLPNSIASLTAPRQGQQRNTYINMVYNLLHFANSSI